jgi:hypothetical protein
VTGPTPDRPRPAPARVRVTGPTHRPAGAPLPRLRQIDEETQLGELYLGSLLREQLRLAAGCLALLACTVGSLPLVFWLFPGLAGVRVLSVPLPWLLIGFLVYPYLLLLGWLYIRSAESNEHHFTDLVESQEDS